MIFAAGLGTRLRPLTNDRPKALVEVNGVTLLEKVIRRLIHFGFDQIIINVHHFAEKVIDFLKKKHHFGIQIAIAHEKDLVLETGGGLKNVSWFFEDGQPFLVHNVDILTDLDLRLFYQHHLTSHALATLAVRKRQTSRYLLFDEKGLLSGWQNVKTGETKIARKTHQVLSQWAFSGIHVINPLLFKKMSEMGVFSIIQPYLRLAATEKIVAYPHTETVWLDVGRLESLEEAKRLTIF